MAKSIHTLFHETLGKLSKSQLAEFQSWREAAGGYPAVTVETQTNALRGILAGQKPDNKQHQRESVRKDNGRADNGGQEFRESADNRDGVGETDPVLREAYKLCEQYTKFHGLSESDSRKVVGLPSVKRSETKLSESQYRVFAKLVMSGKSEREALYLASDDKVSR
jgi:hypothetical protein